MSKKSFKDYSKDNWLRTDDEKPTNEQLQLGCLQRIAEATELMAQNYGQIISERNTYYRWYQQEKAQKEALERSIRAHKANYTRLKNKLEATRGES